jgi:hypothetical protein
LPTIRESRKSNATIVTNTLHLSNEFIDHVAAKNSLILVENQKFVVTHRDKQLREFGDEIKRALNGASVKEIPFDPCNDNFATFVKV